MEERGFAYYCISGREARRFYIRLDDLLHSMNVIINAPYTFENREKALKYLKEIYELVPGITDISQDFLDFKEGKISKDQFWSIRKSQRTAVEEMLKEKKDEVDECIKKATKVYKDAIKKETINNKWVRYALNQPEVRDTIIIMLVFH